jgi:hypothetical protein
MSTFILKAAAGAVLLAASAGALAAATVTFVNIAEMTDVPHHPKDRETMEYAFREHLNHLSERLPAGQVLKVEFLDIDLAGDEFPRVAVRDIRVIKSQTDRMSMHFRYSIEQDGQVLRSGERNLHDAAYTLGANYYDREQYGYEKQMLDDWFRKDVLPAR